MRLLLATILLLLTSDAFSQEPAKVYPEAGSPGWESVSTSSLDELFAGLSSGKDDTILGEIPRTSLENFKSLSTDESFKAKVYCVMRDLEALGWKPLVRNGWRSQAQANANAANGSGVKNSLHLEGLAADIVDASGDGPGKYNLVKEQFWKDLRNTAVKYGLRSGMDFRKVDLPHIDAGLSVSRSVSSDVAANGS